MSADWKRCPKCDKNKKRDKFHFSAVSKDAMQSYCKTCSIVYQAKDRQKRFDADPILYLLNRKRRSYGTDFKLTEEWIREQPTTCPYLGLAFVHEAPGTGKPNQLAPTFDQIVPGGGYTPENTRLISWWANRAKGDMSDEDFRDFCLMVEETIGGRFD